MANNTVVRARIDEHIKEEASVVLAGRVVMYVWDVRPDPVIPIRRFNSSYTQREISMRVIKQIKNGLVTVLALSLFACGGGDSGSSNQNPATGGGPNGTTPVALNDLGTGTYLGFTGGLYPGGSNTVPLAHHQLGLTHTTRVQALDNTGTPNALGKIVLLSIGMSNTTQEFCSIDSAVKSCESWSFMGQAADDVSVNTSTLTIANGARAGQVATEWDASTEQNYNRINNVVLTPLELTESQVQVVWLKVASREPKVSLPDSYADAYTLITQMGNIVRALKIRYPNLQQIFLSSRIYAGYATTSLLSPEPYAYQSGFAVKWLIEAQINQMQTGLVDARAGDLSAGAAAPWLAWGPYLWADGAHARSDGLTWLATEFEADGTHPAQGGESKVGSMLLSFFKSSPYTCSWFLASGCP